MRCLFLLQIGGAEMWTKKNLCDSGFIDTFILSTAGGDVSTSDTWATLAVIHAHEIPVYIPTYIRLA